MSLNIVSLIDIFTVLVFFLLLNTSDIELLPESKQIHLPESTAEARPNETLVVMVNGNEILLQGQLVAHVDAVLHSTDATIPELKSALDRKLPPPAANQDEEKAAEDRAVTVMGDREIPYKLLKKVLATCADADFGKLSLAVLQKAVSVRPNAAANGGAAS